MSRKQQKALRPKALLDVVIVTGGRFDMLAKCLNALYLEAETIPLNVYVIDQNTNLEEKALYRDLFIKRPDSKVLEFRSKRIEAEVGFPAANNEGSRMGMAPLIMFLNDDV
jgi:GT2 family glycosyltransferase